MSRQLTVAGQMNRSISETPKRGLSAVALQTTPNYEAEQENEQFDIFGHRMVNAQRVYEESYDAIKPDVY
jgi:hypothetical protein